MSVTYPSNNDTWLYINTTPAATATYARIGKGVTGATPSNNPVVSTKHYIDATNPISKVTALSKQFALAMERAAGDTANDYIFGKAGKIGADLETDIVVVDHANVAAVTAKPCRKYTVIIVVNNEGAIVGGQEQAMDVAVYCNGDPDDGTFNETTGAFTT